MIKIFPTIQSPFAPAASVPWGSFLFFFPYNLKKVPGAEENPLKNPPLHQNSEKICPEFVLNFQEWRISAVYLGCIEGSNPPLAIHENKPRKPSLLGFRGFTLSKYMRRGH